MNIEKLINTAKALVAGDKGLLTMDEAIRHCNEEIGVWQWVSSDKGKEPEQQPCRKSGTGSGN